MNVFGTHKAAVWGAQERVEGVALVPKPTAAKRKKGAGMLGELCVVTAGESGLLRGWDATTGQRILLTGYGNLD